MNFINKYSWKCLLGPQAKNIEDRDGLFYWQVGSKNHFTTDHLLNQNDLQFLSNKLPINFHYISQDNINILNNFTLEKVKYKSAIINIENLSFTGRKHHGIRNSLNKCKKLNLTIENNYRDIKDIKIMLNNWSETSAVKYFRDYSGKNFHFFKNNFHLDCLSKFFYNGDELVSFGILSLCQEGYSSYVMGKALCLKYPGLSEYSDVIIYEEAKKIGIKNVNLGQSKSGLVFYKEKFGNVNNILHYDGKINEIR